MPRRSFLRLGSSCRFLACVLGLTLAITPFAYAQVPQEGAPAGITKKRLYSEAPQNYYRKSYAVIIGVGDCHDSALRRLHADADAIALRDMLVAHYGFAADDVVLLTNEKATKANIEKALTDLGNAARVGEPDRVLVYLAGSARKQGSDGAPSAFLLPYDAAASDTPSWLPMERVKALLTASPARHRLLIADVPFSGLLVSTSEQKQPEPRPTSPEDMLSKPVVQVLASGSGGEDAATDPAAKHGIFTAILLKQLGKNAETHGTLFAAFDLAQNTRDGVLVATKGEQSPVFGTVAGKGESVFYVAPKTHGIDGKQVQVIAEARPLKRRMPVITEAMLATQPKTVTVRFAVGADGSCTCTIASSSGNADVDEAVRKACAMWEWKPATSGGVPVASVQRISFKPSDLK